VAGERRCHLTGYSARRSGLLNRPQGLPTCVNQASCPHPAARSLSLPFSLMAVSLDLYVPGYSHRRRMLSTHGP
jgi:hypothetical protein